MLGSDLGQLGATIISTTVTKRKRFKKAKRVAVRSANADCLDTLKSNVFSDLDPAIGIVCAQEVKLKDADIQSARQWAISRALAASLCWL